MIVLEGATHRAAIEPNGLNRRSGHGVRLNSRDPSTQTTITLDIGHGPLNATEVPKKCLAAVRICIDCAKDAHPEDFGLRQVQ
jgi:hypothetical protein